MVCDFGAINSLNWVWALPGIKGFAGNHIKKEGVLYEEQD